jgi:hypothetical protein
MTNPPPPLVLTPRAPQQAKPEARHAPRHRLRRWKRAIIIAYCACVPLAIVVMFVGAGNAGRARGAYMGVAISVPDSALFMVGLYLLAAAIVAFLVGLLASIIFALVMALREAE